MWVVVKSRARRLYQGLRAAASNCLRNANLRLLPSLSMSQVTADSKVNVEKIWGERYAYQVHFYAFSSIYHFDIFYLMRFSLVNSYWTNHDYSCLINGSFFFINFVLFVNQCGWQWPSWCWGQSISWCLFLHGPG